MEKVTLTIKLTLIAPFLTKSTNVGTFGIDAPFAKSVDDEFQFPRKLIKGCLRQAVEEIADALGETDKSRIEHWFGDKSLYEKDETNTSVEPKRGKLFFSDFVTNNQGEKKTTTKIRIDSERGAVAENQLLVIETPFKPQERVEFRGNITYFAKDENEYKEIKKLLFNGLKWITNLGALENINFGQLEKVEFINESEEKKSVRYMNQMVDASEILALILKPQDPFCISKRRTTENLFESEEFIPGGVIKGCVAETRKLMIDNQQDLKELDENLYLIRFAHAFPAKTRVRPVVAPLSLVKISQPPFYDVADFKDAILIGVRPQSPAFSVDWKKFDDIDSAFGWEHPKTILSVQTAIENNKAKESQLFAYEKINPAGFEWLGRADLSKITDKTLRTKVAQQLRCVFEQNLFGLGKTKAECEVQMLEETSFSNMKNSAENPKDNKYIITLQTPFLLCKPTELDEESGKDELFNAYKETWENLFDDSATLSHFFASQSLAGGEYLYKRFQFSKSYNPFLLTDAGSVFIFNVTDETQAKAKISDWLENGLPLPDWAKDLYLKNIGEKDYWEHLPFLPENGYGEIVVNLDVHWDNAPTEVIEI